MATKQFTSEVDEHRDAITGEPGSHPIGAGLGASVGGAAAGAAAGMVAGPVGTVAGAVIGGVAGGLAGKEVAEQIEPSVEHHHWRNEYPLSDYYDPTVGYEEVGPAYQYGWESRAEYGERKWEDVEPDLAHEWNERRGSSTLDWGRARPATRDAWDRVDTNFRETDPNVMQPGSAEGRGTPRVPK
jgi:hypothetical protein